MVIANDTTLELVGHQVLRIVTLVTIGGVEGTLAITWFLSSPKAASVITAPSSFSYSSLSETAGACDWQHVRTQREKKLVICSDVRDSELENILLALSSLCAITDLTTCAGVSCCRGVTLRPGTPRPPARIAWHPPFDSLFPHHDRHIITLKWALIIVTFPAI